MLNFNFKTLANSLCVYVENIKSGCDVRYIHDIAHFISVHLLYATTLQAIQAYPCLDIVKREVVCKSVATGFGYIGICGLRSFTRKLYKRKLRLKLPTMQLKAQLL